MAQCFPPYIILASASPRRSMLLREAGYGFEVVPSQGEEIQANSGNAARTVEANARIKGEWVIRNLTGNSQENNETVLVAADTLVAAEDKIYGKPTSMEQARHFIKELGGIEHIVLTGVFLHHIKNSRQAVFHEKTQVVLKTLDDQEITHLFTRSDPMDKAAGYGYQDTPEIVARLSGSETNVIGLPMERLERELYALCHQ